MASWCCSARRCGAAAHGIVAHGVVRCGVAGPIPTLRYLRPARQQRDNQRVVPPPTPEPPATPAVQRRRDVGWRRQTGGIRSHGREPSGSRGAWARGAFGAGVRSWQDYALIRSQALDDGKMLARCVPPPGVRRWRDCALMRSWPDWQWQYSRTVRSRGPCRGKISPRCVPGRQSGASFALHASRKRPRTGKSPVRGKIRAPCIRKRAGFGKICAPCIRNAPQIAVGGCTARGSCQEGALFAARTPRITHGARILPSGVDEAPERPQPLCRRPAPNRPHARNHAAALMAAHHPQHSRCQRQPHRKRPHTPPPHDTEASGGREILRRPSSAAPKRNSGPTAP